MEGINSAMANVQLVGTQSRQVKLLSDVKLLYVSADRKQHARVIVELFRKNVDATVIAVVEAHEADILQVKVQLGGDWDCASYDFEENGSDKILCFYNKKLVGKNVSFDLNLAGKFVTMTVLGPDQDVALELMIVHLPNKNTRKGKPGIDVKEISHKKMRGYWDKIASEGPAIAMGDFNLKPDEINDLLKNGVVAFVNKQLPTNSKHYIRCTDNAYANSYFTLVSFYGEKIDDLSHKVFAVCYKREVCNDDTYPNY